MAKILLGWELGGNYGHVNQLKALSKRLIQDGHSVYLALQRIDAGKKLFGPPEYLLQAPVWPNCLKDVYRHVSEDSAANYGDMLIQFCFDKKWALPSMISGWNAILKHVKPDAIIADSAPALLMAAKNKIPTIRIGSGYDVPPFTMKAFPPLYGKESVENHELAVEKVNAALKLCGQARINFLPQCLMSDQDMVAVFKAFDPYYRWRKTRYYTPSVPNPLPSISDRMGEEIFVYYQSVTKEAVPLWDALAESKLPVRLHIPDLDKTHIDAFRDLGFKFEEAPVPIEDIIKKSRLLISHGGLGMASTALLCGLPHLILSHDLEKSLNGHAVSGIGLGKHMSIFRANKASILENIFYLYNKNVNGKKIATDFRQKISIPFNEQVAVEIKRWI